MTRHYILFDTNITHGSRFDETDLGTDLSKALKDAEHSAGYLTRTEMKKRDEFCLKACDIPEDVDMDEVIWSDYVVETIADYKYILENESNMVKNIVAEYSYLPCEIYRFTSRNHRLHPEYVEMVDEEDVKNEIAVMYNVMSEDEYAETIGMDEDVDFADWFGEEVDEILVIFLEEK